MESRAGALPLKSLSFSVLLALAVSSGAQTPATESQELKWQPPVERPQLGNYIGEPGISPETLTEGFLSAHPDLRWRREGLYSYESKEYDVALEQFKRAARYSDKPSQAMLGEMYWKGTGIPQDKAIAYAWMDLAAERMYPNFVILRERYWNELSQAQRVDAIERGQEILAAYGDDVAKPRLAKILDRERRNITGSRLGYVGFLKIIPLTGPLAGTGMTVNADQYYADKYWKPNVYFKMQDELWNAPIPLGQVNVGKLENAPKPAENNDGKSRADNKP